MAGPACKVIINSGLHAVSKALERILSEPLLHGGKIEDRERRTMIQQLADIDAVAYHGGTVSVSLVDIMARLESLGVLSGDVWNIYASKDRRSSGGNDNDNGKA